MWLPFIIKAFLSRCITDIKSGFCIIIDVKYFHSKCSFSYIVTRDKKFFKKCKSESAIHVCKFSLRADVSYLLCCTRKRDVCVSASLIVFQCHAVRGINVA